MKVLIYANGTEGDIRPFVALARGLHAAGHEAALCAPEGFVELVTGHGVELLAMDDEMLQLMQGTMARLRGPLDIARAARRMTRSMRQMMLDQWTAARTWRPDAIVYHPKTLGAPHVAEALDVPATIALPLPMFTPTGEFPIPFIGDWPLGEAANRASYRMNHFEMLIYGSMINAFRTRTLGLPAKARLDDLKHRRDGSRVPTLYPISPHLVPPPADYPASAHITGAWSLDDGEEAEPSAALEDFLTDGEPPVYVGFGSMGFGSGATQRTEHLVAALRRHGRRIVLATGWGGLTAVEGAEDVLSLTSASHEWLFPRVEAVIHHGGSGTVHAGLRAGRPTLICPFLGDQPFWGKRVQEAGVGPAPVPRRVLASDRGDRLEEAVDRLLHDDGIRERAAELGRAMRTEDGVAAAVEILTGDDGP
ncbi:glycosyltransferase [Brachybacterium fresconis]|uniref:Sterol 3beta-glucosyltransferase n=1 Tax=Brachybacterium fresconis TaxID=173363 RepID=A0ABS4YNC4_9MICO|nr:glycosyltransferase [Brachybacterium fresconis]MBP2410291.1 sterol 3beta-glucosyltransferase [Brachybacterium fresconis]